MSEQAIKRKIKGGKKEKKFAQLRKAQFMRENQLIHQPRNSPQGHQR